MISPSDPSTGWPSTADGARSAFHPGWAMAGPSEYRQARELAQAFAAHGVRYLLGKGAAILLGFPDTTQDADVFVEKTPENGRALLKALASLGFELTAP